ncbi:MAG: hypothetical protein H6605_00215 [Flavobacteriales bacterium]|nr:hypothetical protein [Flavobacteriales bacterium]
MKNLTHVSKNKTKNLRFYFKSVLLVLIFFIFSSNDSFAQAYYQVDVTNNSSPCYWTIQGYKGGSLVWTSIPNVAPSGGTFTYNCGQYGGSDDIDEIWVRVDNTCIVKFYQSSGWSGSSTPSCCSISLINCSATTPGGPLPCGGASTEFIQININ